MQEGVEKRLRQKQAAYRRGRGTTEQIFILRNISEKSAEWQASLYIGFIDFKKAFDSVRRDRLWNILKNYGIPVNFVNIIRELYDGSTCCVVERGQTSDWFPVESGVKQGCVMSGFLFNIIIDWIMQNTNNARRGLRWKFTTVLEDLDYADDIALLSSRHKDLQEKCNRLRQVSRSCVTSVLLYGAEMGRITSTDIEQLDVFHRKCLRRILGIFWPHTISNCDLYERTKQRPISKTMKVRRWRWIGHILRREKDNNCRVALTGPLRVGESEEDPRFRGEELWKVSVKTWAGLAGIRWNSEQKNVKDGGRFWVALFSS
ncbi:hypothetical protein ACROYT_G025283 [Oculina patagonica]